MGGHGHCFVRREQMGRGLIPGERTEIHERWYPHGNSRKTCRRPQITSAEPLSRCSLAGEGTGWSVLQNDKEEERLQPATPLFCGLTSCCR
jgi:hypothetical protein